jgi:thiamine-phosphate pyrophosphorylase
MRDKHKLPRGFYALIDDGVRPEWGVVGKAEAAIEGGARVLQLRLEQTSDRAALELIRAVVGRAKGAGVVVIVNDRVDLALLGGADGVHLGADDLPVREARALLGAEALVGATARNLEQIRLAQGNGADHVGVGPVFSTTTKAVDHVPLGLEGLRAICSDSPLPVVAIAGISLETIGLVAQAGAWCAAVAGDFLRSSEPVSRARALQRAFSDAR